MNSIRTYIKKIHSSLHGSSSVRISSFIDEHRDVHPLLHTHATSKNIDVDALLYIIKRLPPEIFKTKKIIMAPTSEVFEEKGVDLSAKDWVYLKETMRHRKRKYNARERSLAVFITSFTDVEDSITIVTAFYIEALKLSKCLKETKKNLKECLGKDNYRKLKDVLKKNFSNFENYISSPVDFEYILLAGSYNDFSKAVQNWWIDIAATRKKQPFNIYKQPVYFISSNPHSIANLLSGYPVKMKKNIFSENKEFIEENKNEIESEKVSDENLCYYLSRFSESSNKQYRKDKSEHEKKYKLINLEPKHDIDIKAQLFSIRDFVKNKDIDSRISITAAMRKKLLKSNALIFNISYPLGMGAYNILREVSEDVIDLRGLYIIGKAASLNASVGDITIPSFVRDMHTYNHIYLNNIFKKANFQPYIKKRSIFMEQKAVTVRGTFLQNATSMMKNFDDGFTIFEMELGPYLNRIYELIYPERYPTEETFIVNPDFRLGVAYYVSDTPHKKGMTLGSKSLKFEGLNATYGISLGVINDILKTEYKKY